jgi:protease-4
MHRPAFDALVASVQSLDLQEHLGAVRAALAGGAVLDVRPAYHVESGVGIIDVVGVLTKYGSSLTDGPSTLGIREVLRMPVGDPTVRAIVLRIDSPGGSARGIDDLAADIGLAASVKPLTVFAEDAALSGAFWIAAGAGRIVANRGALIGSIGTYTVVTDVSAQAEKLGIKVMVVKAGEMKGVGEPGTEVTDDQLADVQRVVNEVNELFVGAVAAGRGMPRQRAEALADGRVHVAGEALRLGLIDAIGTFDDVLAQAVDVPLRAKPQQKGTLDMAGIQDVLDKLTAMEARHGTLEARLGTLEAAVKAGPPAPVGGPGVPAGRARAPRAADGDEDAEAREITDAREQHEFAVQARQLAHDARITEREAQRRIAARDPELYHSFREQYRRAYADLRPLTPCRAATGTA